MKNERSNVWIWMPCIVVLKEKFCRFYGGGGAQLGGHSKNLMSLRGQEENVSSKEILFPPPPPRDFINERSLTKDLFTKGSFGGVYACDQLSFIELNKYPKSFVVNTDPMELPGTHWIAIYLRNKWKENSLTLTESIRSIIINIS